MKKVLILALLLSGYSLCFAQGKFSAKVTNSGNNLIFQLKPDVTTSTGFSTIEFFLKYTTSSPAFSYGLVTVNTTDFPGMAGNGTTGGGAVNSGAWEIIHNDPNVTAISGFNVDHFIYTAPSVATTPASYTGGTPYDVITIHLIGTLPNTVDFQFISDDTYSTSYLAITDQNGGDLLPASPNNYFFPTTSSTPLGGGATLYFQDLANVPVPVKFLDFSASKKNNSAVLNWYIENESAVTDRYEILRSTDAVNFNTIATISPKKNGNSTNKYELTDNKFSTLSSNSGMIYYRIKQVDKDGKSVYTDVKSIRLDGKVLKLSVYPNPIKDFTTLSIDAVQDATVEISISDASGKQIENFQMKTFAGNNNRRINLSSYASGNYLMKVQTATEVKTIAMVKTN